MTTTITRKLYRKVTHKKWNAEMKVLRAKLKHTQYVTKWKEQYLAGIHYAFVGLTRGEHGAAQRARYLAEKKMHAAYERLIKRQMEHKALLESIRHGYQFRQESQGLYHPELFLTLRMKMQRFSVKRALALATRQSVSREITSSNAHLGDIPELKVSVTQCILSVLQDLAKE